MSDQLANDDKTLSVNSTEPVPVERMVLEDIIIGTVSQSENVTESTGIKVDQVSTEKTNEDDTKEQTNSKKSRELKLLLALSKEANLDTNILHKRKTLEGKVKDKEVSPLTTTPERGTKVATDARNFRYPVTAEAELELDGQENEIKSTVENSNKTSKRKRDGLSEVNTGGATEEAVKRNKSSFSTEAVMFRENKDIFCWRCHREGVNISCETCPRSYHQKCLKQVIHDTDHWPCPECVAILKAESTQTRTEAMKGMTLEHLCGLLKFAVNRMIQCNGSEPFLSPVNDLEFPNYKKYIIQPMDLTKLERNIKDNLYGSPQAFEADAKWLLHNSIIFNSCQSKLTTVAKNIMKICKQEMTEIENCSSCYLNANTKKSTWFVEVCPKPHLLVWAKLKGFPYWPAKAMCTNVSGMVDVRFFGAHDRAWVHYKECYLFSEKDPNTFKQKRYDIERCIEELNIYIQNLRKVYGEFKYAPYRTLLEPGNESKQLQIFLPRYKLNVSPKKRINKHEVKSLSQEKKEVDSKGTLDVKENIPNSIPEINDDVQVTINSEEKKNKVVTKEDTLNVKFKESALTEKTAKISTNGIFQDDSIMEGYGTDDDTNPEIDLERRKTFIERNDGNVSEKMEAEYEEEDNDTQVPSNIDLDGICKANSAKISEDSSKISGTNKTDLRRTSDTESGQKRQVTEEIPHSPQKMSRRNSDQSVKSDSSRVSNISDKINRVDISENMEITLGNDDVGCVSISENMSSSSSESSKSSSDHSLETKKKPVQVDIENTEYTISPSNKLKISDKLIKRLSDGDENTNNSQKVVELKKTIPEKKSPTDILIEKFKGVVEREIIDFSEPSTSSSFDENNRINESCSSSVTNRDSISLNIETSMNSKTVLPKQKPCDNEKTKSIERPKENNTDNLQEKILSSKTVLPKQRLSDKEKIKTIEEPKENKLNSLQCAQEKSSSSKTVLSKLRLSDKEKPKTIEGPKENRADNLQSVQENVSSSKTILPKQILSDKEKTKTIEEHKENKTNSLQGTQENKKKISESEKVQLEVEKPIREKNYKLELEKNKTYVSNDAELILSTITKFVSDLPKPSNDRITKDLPLDTAKTTSQTANTEKSNSDNTNKETLEIPNTPSSETSIKIHAAVKIAKPVSQEAIAKSSLDNNNKSNQPNHEVANIIEEFEDSEENETIDDIQIDKNNIFNIIHSSLNDTKSKELENKTSSVGNSVVEKPHTFSKKRKLTPDENVDSQAKVVKLVPIESILKRQIEKEKISSDMPLLQKSLQGKKMIRKPSTTSCTSSTSRQSSSQEIITEEIKSEPDTDDDFSESENLEAKRKYLSALNISEKISDAAKRLKANEIRTRSKTEEKKEKFRIMDNLERTIDDVALNYSMNREKLTTKTTEEQKNNTAPQEGEIFVKSFARLQPTKQRARKSFPTPVYVKNTIQSSVIKKNVTPSVPVTKKDVPKTSTITSSVVTPNIITSTGLSTIQNQKTIETLPNAVSHVILLPPNQTINFSSPVTTPVLNVVSNIISSAPVTPTASTAASNIKSITITPNTRASQNYIPQNEQPNGLLPNNSSVVINDVTKQSTINTTPRETEQIADVVESNVQVPTVIPTVPISEAITGGTTQDDDFSVLNSLLPDNVGQAVSDLLLKPPPRLKPRPPGILSACFDEGVPSSAGNVTSTINSVAHRLGDYFRGMLIETLEDLGKTSNPEAKIISLQLEIDSLKHRHNLELQEIRKNVCTILKDIQKSIIEDREKIIDETRAACEAETIKRIELAKSKQWCANCSKEAQFYCCWNTSYCDYPCQQKHWPQHVGKCTQNVEKTNTTSTLTNRPTGQQLILRPAIPAKPGVGRVVAKPTKVYMNRTVGPPKTYKTLSTSGNHLTVIETTPGNYELLGNGPIAVTSGKFLTTSSNIFQSKFKTANIVSVSSPSTSGTCDQRNIPRITTVSNSVKSSIPSTTVSLPVTTVLADDSD